MIDIKWIKNFYLETEMGFLGREDGMISIENSDIVQEEQKLVPQQLGNLGIYVS